MSLAYIVAASLLGAAVAAADQELWLSNGLEATPFEQDAAFLLQITCFNASTGGRGKNVAEEEVLEAADKTNTTVVMNKGVANAAVSNGSAIDDVRKEAALRVESSFAGADVAMLNSTMGDVSGGQHEIEMPQVPADAPTKSKVALVVISALALGMCGVDRCYMGATCCGIIKGLTAGGLGIWAIIDWFVILISSLEKDSAIDSLGFRAKFYQDGLDTAYWISLMMLIIPIVSFLCCGTCFCVGVGGRSAYQFLGQARGKRSEAAGKPLTEEKS